MGDAKRINRVAGVVLVAACLFFAWVVFGSSSSPRSEDPILRAPDVVESLAGQVVQREIDDIARQVAKDAVQQWVVAKKAGSKMDACVQAGLVSAALIQAKQEEVLREWKKIERADCARAGMPGEP